MIPKRIDSYLHPLLHLVCGWYLLQVNSVLHTTQFRFTLSTPLAFRNADLQLFEQNLLLAYFFVSYGLLQT